MIIDKEKRISWIDMAKGYGILFVIWAHLGTGALSTWMYSFHVPLFFFLSGVTFSAKADFKQFIIKKAKALLLPYLFLGLVMIAYYIFASIINKEFTSSFFLKIITNFILQKRYLTLWFLTTLFLLNVMAYPLIKKVKNQIVLLAVSIVMLIAGLLYYKSGGGAIVWNIDVCFTAMPFFMVGYLYKKNYTLIQNFFYKKSRKILAFVTFLGCNILFLVLSISISGQGLDMHGNVYGCEPLMYLSAFFGIFAIVILSKAFELRCIIYIGKNSLLYYVWHLHLILPFAIKLWEMCGFLPAVTSGILIIYIYRIILLFTVIVMCTICNTVIQKTKLKFMLGK